MPTQGGAVADYSLLDRVLHRLALGSTALAELSFDLEKQFARPSAQRRDAVYVTGLARAGTTALMRALHDNGQFASLTYDDMPFLLAPNLWAKLSGIDKRQRILQERAHGDGVQVDFDSPEALEGVFWRMQCGGDYIKPAFLQPHELSRPTLVQLGHYQSLVCRRYGRERYLAKNNNLMLRLSSMAAQQPDTTFLVVFRDPLAQARSLLQQHKRRMLLGALAMTVCYNLFYTATVFCLSYGTQTLGIARVDFLQMLCFAVLFMALITPLSAAMSDRYGRKPVLLIGCFLAVMVGFSLNPLLSHGNPYAITLFLSLALLLMGATFAPMGAFLPEQFPVPVRYSGAGLSYNLGGILGASSAPYVSQLLVYQGGLTWVGYYVSSMALVSLIAVWCMQEHRP